MKLTITISFFLFLSTQAQVSPFNGDTLEVNHKNYSFIVSAHFYGNSSNKTGYPVNTLLGHIDEINAQHPAFLMCLGDLFLDVKNDIPFYKKSLFTKLHVPLFNSVGNHDLSDNVYQDNFGSTSFDFQIQKDYHLIIDSERDNGDLSEDQLTLLEKALTKAKNNELKNVFIYGHRTLWVDSYEEMNGLFTTNTQSLTPTNFKSEVYPILKELSTYSNVFWFAGSLGDAPASFFYHKDKALNITYIATAIRGLERDALLKVNSENGKISFDVESLTGQNLKPLEEYNVEYWKENIGKEEPFNWRLTPLYIKNVLTHRYFYYGIIVFILSLFSFKFLIKLIRKRKT